MLTKAETQKRFIEARMKTRSVKDPKALFADHSIKVMYADMEQTYVRLHQLGYRRMPEEMYLRWMGMLKNEPDKTDSINIDCYFDMDAPEPKEKTGKNEYNEFSGKGEFVLPDFAKFVEFLSEVGK